MLNCSDKYFLQIELAELETIGHTLKNSDHDVRITNDATDYCFQTGFPNTR